MPSTLPPATKRSAAGSSASQDDAKARDKDKAAKQRDKDKAAKARDKDKAAKQREKERAAKQKEKERAAKQKEKERAAKQKEKERAAKEKERAAKQKEKERPGKQKDADKAGKSAGSRKGSGGKAGIPPYGEVAAGLGKENAVTRSTKKPTLAASYTTRDHDIIKAWVESRNGQPADVRGTGGSGAGVLRIEFRDEQDQLEPADWDAFFATFDESDVDFLYQEHTADGGLSRFNKIVRADA